MAARKAAPDEPDILADYAATLGDAGQAGAMLKVVRALASHVIVMQNGRVVEEGPAASLFAAPGEDYTRALFAAAFHR